MDSSLDKKRGFFNYMLKCLTNKVVGIATTMKKNAKDDPRRVIHSLKMALALTLVSSFYSVRQLYDGIGVSGMWAIITVVVVFEFTVGATISRCLNRGFATLLAGSLGMGVQHFASLFGDKGEAIVLGASVFFLAAMATFTRFIPRVKARYDYGMLIFILTFSMVVVSGYRVEEIVQMASTRIMTIIMGVTICLIISISICPIWAGQDLHNLMAENVEKIAEFLEGFEEKYFEVLDKEVDNIDFVDEKKSFLTSYKNILISKASEDSLANFMRWEPYCHGRFSFRHPWKQYQKIGALARECAYQLEALSVYVNSDVKIAIEFRRKIQDSCIKMSKESRKALRELSSSLKAWTYPIEEAETHVENSKEAVKEVERILKSGSLSLQHEQDQLLSVVSDVTVVSILISVVDCVAKLEEAINDLAKMSCFKTVEPTVSPETKASVAQLLHRGIVIPVFDEEAVVGSGGDVHVCGGEHVIKMQHEVTYQGVEHERCAVSGEIVNANANSGQDHVITVVC